MIYQSIQGVNVPALGLGTYRLTGQDCRTAVADALSIGYRHIDTAQSYDNEEEVGRALRDSSIDRDDVFLTTKIGVDNLDPESVRSSTEESLRKLDVEYVDLLLIHWPSDQVPLERTLDAMLEFREEGRTRHLGVSNFTPDLVERAAAHAPIFSNQVEYHPFLGQQDLVDQARSKDYLLTAYSPIARGKVREDETLQRIAAKYAKSAAQVALRWLIQQENVAAIPKAASTDHREQNFDIFDFELSEDEMNEVSSLGRGDRIVNPSWGPDW